MYVLFFLQTLYVHAYVRVFVCVFPTKIAVHLYFFIALVLIHSCLFLYFQVHYLDSVIVSFDQGIKFVSVEYVQAKITKEMKKGKKPSMS